MNCQHSGLRTPDSRLQTFLAVFSLVLSLSLGSCTARRPVQPPPSQPTELPSAQQLLANFAARPQALTSLRGLARVVYADPQNKGTAKQAVAVSIPDRFRLELFSPIGIASLVVCDGHSLAAYFPKEKTIYRGAATPLNVARFTRVMLSPRAIVGVLLGLPIPPQYQEARPVTLDADRGWYRLGLTLPEGGTQVWWFDPRTLLLTRWEALGDNDAVVARMNLNDYRLVNGQYFPFEIGLSDLSGQQEVSIYYERVELNPQLPDTLFTLAPLNGVQEIDIDALNP
jgi:outer membrane lipoprotein-sorting protein